MGRVFVSADWHGCLDPAQKVLDFLQPDDKLYFLGDAIDRGPHGYKIMTKLLNDPRVEYLMGNHEAMMLEAIEHMITYGLNDYQFYGMDDNWLYGNGGIKTFEDMNCGIGIDLPKLYKNIKNMPTYAILTLKDKKIILEHAGYTPDKDGRVKWDNKHHDPVWDRDHFWDPWSGAEDMYLIHGHTPVQYLQFEYGYYDRPKLTKEELQLKITWDIKGKYTPQVICYCNGHKFDIDMCTIVSGRIALLDLDTFEVIYFDDEGEEK